ncbi:MAG: endonuclease/exonuclease/phosphatase family protein [Akkermansiaceae bacterium]|jgi:exonuclease III
MHNKPSWSVRQSVAFKLWAALLVGAITSLEAQHLSVEDSQHDADQAIEFTFSGGPGHPADWVGIYSPGEKPGKVGSKAWIYTNGTRKKGGDLSKGKVTFPGGTLEPGQYEVWFLTANAYEPLAGPVEIQVRPAKVKPGWFVPRIRRIHGVAGRDYFGRIGAYARSSDHTFQKIGGPAWLSVSNNGMLTGRPGRADIGVNTFRVRVSDGNRHEDAELVIEIFPSGKENVRELKVMTYNAWMAWSRMENGYRKGLESIILSDADLIGMQESSGGGKHLPERLANDLGWHYRKGANGSIGILSRYPITDESLAAGIALGAKIRLSTAPLREVVLMNCHLDPHHYGPYAAQKEGATVKSVMTEELISRRDDQIETIIKGMVGLLAESEKTPVFLTGDFNAPSHLDWTKAAAKEHDGISGVAWPTSMTVVKAGMIDSFREANPDPVRHPGNTWSPVFRGKEPQDRIDLIYYKGRGLKTVSSKVFTTAVEATLGRETTATSAVRNNTWPSDHAAVISTFRLGPAGGGDE